MNCNAFCCVVRVAVAALLIPGAGVLPAAEPEPPGKPVRGTTVGAGVTATILREPADWRLETMSVPPGFARDVKLTGAEEIRFAPGMFDPGSSNYWTCALVILADGAPKLGAAEIRDFLERYYRGLSMAVGRRRGLSPDPAQMRAVVNPAPSPAAADRFVAQVVFFDSFSDGRKITLNVEARVLPRPALRQTCLMLLVSPSPKESTTWQTLREIGGKTAVNLLGAN